MKKTGYNIIQFSLSKELQHGMMVSILAGELARKAGLSEEQCHELSIAGLLHDIGKLEMAKYVYQKAAYDRGDQVCKASSDTGICDHIAKSLFGFYHKKHFISSRKL